MHNTQLYMTASMPFTGTTRAASFRNFDPERRIQTLGAF